MKEKPEKYKFHHPGSGRKKSVPFAKGRQAKSKDLEAVGDCYLLVNTIKPI